MTITFKGDEVLRKRVGRLLDALYMLDDDGYTVCLVCHNRDEYKWVSRRGAHLEECPVGEVEELMLER